MENEYDVIGRILDGKSQDFEKIVLRYQNLVFSVCLNIVGNHTDAENLAQETFLSAYCSLASFSGANFKSWLCRIAVNKCIDFKRKQTKLLFMDDIENEARQSDDVGKWLEQKEKKEKLAQILKDIPDKYALVIKAFYYDGFKVKEIAKQIRKPEKTVETQLYRAKRLIKRRWGEDDVF